MYRKPPATWASVGPLLESCLPCSILRFWAAWHHLRAGQLYAEGDFADQAHFIREIKKYTGVAPKEVVRNHNDRFIQFSTLPKP